MKRQICFLVFILCFCHSRLFAQSSSMDGLWKLVSQTSTLADGRTINADSSHLVQVKMFVDNHFMVIDQAAANGMKRFMFSAGGHCVCNGNECTEINDYASYGGYELVKTHYHFTIEGNTMTQTGSVTHQDGSVTKFEETYVREK